MPPGLTKPHHFAALVPVLAAFAVVVGSLGLAVSHLAAKGGAPQADATAAAATGQTPPTRSVYSASDYSEPNLK